MSPAWHCTCLLRWLSRGFQFRRETLGFTFCLLHETLFLSFKTVHNTSIPKIFPEQSTVGWLTHKLVDLLTGPCKISPQRSPWENRKLHINAAFFPIENPSGLLHFLIYCVWLNEMLSEILNIKICLPIIIYNHKELCSQAGGMDLI